MTATASTGVAEDRREYAGVVSRAGAFLADAALVTLVAFGAVAVVALVTLVVGAQGRHLARTMVSILAIALPALLAAYGGIFWALAGRTPGMALLGLRVVSTAGRRPRWLACVIRAVVLAYFPIGSLWCLVDRRHQAIHDKLARTTVVRTASAAGAGHAALGGRPSRRSASSLA
jgi:uncharacterized RDD family membrane protein YckC